MELAAIGRSIRESASTLADDIVERWCRIGEAESWLALPDGLGFDHLPPMIESLADAALLTDFEPAACRQLAVDGARHGTDRAAEGFGQALVFREYHLLGRALRLRMRETFGESARTFYANMRLDTGISLASAASVLGLNRDTLEEDGRWDDALDRVVDEWRGIL